jgi:hypothetical protein
MESIYEEHRRNQNLTAALRIGHIHLSVDDAAWHWADASGNPNILQGIGFRGAGGFLTNENAMDENLRESRLTKWTYPRS